MKLKLFIVTIIILNAFACTTNKQVKVGMGGCYELTGEEQETPVSKEHLKLYNDELKIAETESYINRLVVDNNSKKFFGFILKDVKDIILSKIKKDSTITIVDEKTVSANNTEYNYFKIKGKDNLMVVKVIMKQEVLSNSIAMDAVFENEDDWNKFYENTEDFTTRLNCKDEKE